MKIGYARVSTDDQNLHLQLDALKAGGCDAIFEDRGVSGALAERGGLAKAIAAVGEGDVLVVWRLDRLGRSLAFLIELIEELGRSGAGFQSLTDGIDTTTANGRLIFHIMGALAEFERALIGERTKAGMAAAKRRGVRIGRPRKLTPEQIAQARALVTARELRRREIAALLGVSPKTLRRALKEA